MSTCRICDRKLEDGTVICPNCGRMVVNFPKTLPQKLQDYLINEKEFYNRQNASEGDIQRDLREKERKINNLEGEIKKLQEEITAKTNQIASMEKDLQDLKNYIAYWICPNCKIPYQVNANNCTRCGNIRPKRVMSI